MTLFSCKRECDCQELALQYSYSEQVELPEKTEVKYTNESSLNISIDENNMIRLDSEVKSILDIENIIVNLLENDEEPKIKVSANAKSDFSVFNSVLNLSKTHQLALIIVQE